MTCRDALKLHNEDEVFDKSTGISVRVLSVKDVPEGIGGFRQC